MPAKRQAPDIYKTATVTLAGIVITLIGSWMTIGRNTLTKDEFEKLVPGLVQVNNPYTLDQRNIGSQLTALHDEQVRQSAALQQIAIDVGRLSEKAGVAAHPTLETK